MKIFLLCLLVSTFVLAKSVSLSKTTDKQNAESNPKVESSQKVEKSKISKSGDSKSETLKVLPSSKIDASKDTKQREKHELRLEESSDQKEVDRAKKSCKTLTSPLRTPARFCLQISDTPSTVTICDDDRPSTPIINHETQHHHQRPIYNFPFNIYERPGYETDIPYQNVIYETVSQQTPHTHTPQYGYPQSQQIAQHHHPVYSYYNHLPLHRDKATATEPEKSIYIVPGSQSYSYPSGGGYYSSYQSYPPSYSSYPASSSGGHIPPLTQITCIPTPIAGTSNYFGRSDGSSILDRSSPYSSTSGLRSDDPSDTIISGIQPLPNARVISPNLDSDIGGPTRGLGIGLGLNGIKYPGLVRANLGGLEASTDLGDQGISTNLGYRDGNLKYPSSVVKIPGVDISTNWPRRHSLSIGHPLKSKNSRTSDQAIDVWGPVIPQGQRYSRGPDSNLSGSQKNEAKNQLQSQIISSTQDQTNSSPVLNIESSQKLPREIQAMKEKNPMDDDEENFQETSVQQFMVDRTRQHLHQESDHPSLDSRFDNINRINN